MSLEGRFNLKWCRKRVECVGTESSRPEAYGVIYKDDNGIMHRACLKGKGQIILSAW